MGMKAKEGKYTVLRKEGGRYEVDCFNWYHQDGFLVIEHKDGDIEYFPIGQIACVVKYKSKQESEEVTP